MGLSGGYLPSDQRAGCLKVHGYRLLASFGAAPQLKHRHQSEHVSPDLFLVSHDSDQACKAFERLHWSEDNLLTWQLEGAFFTLPLDFSQPFCLHIYNGLSVGTIQITLVDAHLGLLH